MIVLTEREQAIAAHIALIVTASLKQMSDLPGVQTFGNPVPLDTQIKAPAKSPRQRKQEIVNMLDKQLGNGFRHFVKI